jgi:hypothetical protein
LKIKDKKACENKTETVVLNKSEWILPNFCIKKRKNIRILDLCTDIINKKLSIETVFNTSHKIELLANSILKDIQVKEFRENNKIYLDLKANKEKNKIKHFMNVSKFDLTKT